MKRNPREPNGATIQFGKGLRHPIQSEWGAVNPDGSTQRCECSVEVPLAQFTLFYEALPTHLGLLFLAFLLRLFLFDLLVSFWRLQGQTESTAFTLYTMSMVSS